MSDKNKLMDKLAQDCDIKSSQLGRDSAQVLILDPRQLVEDPNLNVRFYVNQAKEQKRLEALADSLIRHGQLDTILVGPPRPDGRFPIIAGNRRWRAALIANEKLSANGKSRIRLRCAVDGSNDPFRDALESNIRRQDMGPISRALLIPAIRNRYPELADGSARSNKLIANMLGLDSAASTYQYEKLLKLPGDIQELVESRQVSMSAVLLILDRVPPEKVREVLDEARDVQIDRARADVEKLLARSGTSTDEPSGGQAQADQTLLDQANRKLEKAVSGPIETPAVKETIRRRQEGKSGVGEQIVGERSAGDQVEKTKPSGASGATRATGASGASGATEPESESKPVPRTRKEILDWFDGQDGPGNGPYLETSPGRKFIRYLIDRWAKGTGTDSQLQRLWNQMALTGTDEDLSRARNAVEQTRARVKQDAEKERIAGKTAGKQKQGNKNKK